MYVVKENEITDSMYIIHTGTVEEVAEDLEEQTQLLHDGEFFGIVSFFTTWYTFLYIPTIHTYKNTFKKIQLKAYSLDNYTLCLLVYQ